MPHKIATRPFSSRGDRATSFGVWSPDPVSSSVVIRRLGVAIAKVRAVLFFLWTLTVAVPLFVVMLAIFPLVRLTDR